MSNDLPSGAPHLIPTNDGYGPIDTRIPPGYQNEHIINKETGKRISYEDYQDYLRALKSQVQWPKFGGYVGPGPSAGPGPQPGQQPDAPPNPVITPGGSPSPSPDTIPPLPGPIAPGPIAPTTSDDSVLDKLDAIAALVESLRAQVSG